MAKYWIRGLFALLITSVVSGVLAFVVVYGIDRQAEITRFQIETEAQVCRDAWEAQKAPTHVTIEMESEDARGYGAAAMRRLPPPPEMPEKYPEPVIVMPREWDGSPSPWPGNPEPPRRESPFVVEPPLVPPTLNSVPQPTRPYTPGSTDPARREEFRRPQVRPQPQTPLNPGKVAQL